MCVLELADGIHLGETSLMHMASNACSLERLTGCAGLGTLLNIAEMAPWDHLKGLPVRNLSRQHTKISIRQSGSLSYPHAGVLFSMATLHDSVNVMTENLSSSTDRAEMSRFLFSRLASDASQVLPEARAAAN